MTIEREFSERINLENGNPSPRNPGARPNRPQRAEPIKPPIDPAERRRLVVHLARMFADRYDFKVLPGGVSGLWGCMLGPEAVELSKQYIRGEIESLDGFPSEIFTPEVVLYDEQAALAKGIDEVSSNLGHEGSHAKYSDFKSMVEGQKQAADEGYLPTSYWLMNEGLEDPRVNNLNGRESKFIDRQRRTVSAKHLEDRLAEKPISQRPVMLQFAYNCLNYWLNGEQIPELVNTPLGEAFKELQPLIDAYHQNTDLEGRKLLQKQIWDIVKFLEKKEIRKEVENSMPQPSQPEQEDQNQQESGQDSPASPQEAEQDKSGDHDQQSEEQESSQPNQAGEDTEDDQGGEQSGGSEGQDSDQQAGQSQGQDQQTEGQEESSQSSQNQQNAGAGSVNESNQDNEKMGGVQSSAGGNGQQTSQPDGAGENQLAEQSESQQSGGGSGAESNGASKLDINKLAEELARQTEQSINDEQKKLDDLLKDMTQEERQEIINKARQAVDDKQKQSLEQTMSKTFKFEKNDQTGEYEAVPQTIDQGQVNKGEHEVLEAVKRTEEEEARDRVEWQERLNNQMERIRQQQEALREREEMQKAGFDPNRELDKYQTYRDLERSMLLPARNFITSLMKEIPRKQEEELDGSFNTGKRFDHREIVRQVPVGREQFWQRPLDIQSGDPRLFVGLLIDKSGSMEGRKMAEARKTGIFFSMVCQQMRIPFMGVSFADYATVIKEFGQDFDNPSYRVKPRLIDETISNGNTNMYAGLELVVNAMEREQRKLRNHHGLVFVISDGQANQGLKGEDLQHYIEEKRGRITFQAFGLAESSFERAQISEYLNYFFGESNCVCPESFEQLPLEAFRLLRLTLRRFRQLLV